MSTMVPVHATIGLSGQHRNVLDPLREFPQLQVRQHIEGSYRPLSPQRRPVKNSVKKKSLVTPASRVGALVVWNLFWMLKDVFCVLDGVDQEGMKP